MRASSQRLWSYRYFVVSSIKTELFATVARSKLGLVWHVISPVMQVAIYALILSAVMTQRLPGIDNQFAYSIYLIAGFMAWFPFVDILNRCLMVFIANGNAMKKIAFPRAILPVISVGSATVHHLIFAVTVMVAFALMGHNPGMVLVWYPVLYGLTAGLALGTGLILGILNVFVRDVQQIVAILIQFGFWMTPIVYMIEIIPESVQPFLKLNPLFWVVDSYHNVFAYGIAPDLAALFWLACLSVALLLGALFLFRRAAPEMVDVL